MKNAKRVESFKLITIIMRPVESMKEVSKNKNR